jgi:ribonucleoside-triphosphate reductase
MITKLNKTQIESKIKFIENYINSKNAASVTQKNIATLEAEINKDVNIQVNRKLIYNKIKSEFDEETAEEYIRQIEAHEIYIHDETSLKPYCVSIHFF